MEAWMSVGGWVLAASVLCWHHRDWLIRVIGEFLTAQYDDGLVCPERPVYSAWRDSPKHLRLIRDGHPALQDRVTPFDFEAEA